MAFDWVSLGFYMIPAKWYVIVNVIMLLSFQLFLLTLLFFSMIFFYYENEEPLWMFLF